MPNLPTITPMHPASLGMASTLYVAGAVASLATGSQNAMFFPWLVQVPLTIVKGFTMNGATANGNNDIGVYDHGFNLIVSIGATLQSGTNAIQEYDITDTTLNPGRYWIAVLNTGTGTFFSWASQLDEVALSVMPFLIQTGQTALPATASPIKDSRATPSMPLFGFSTLTTI